MSGRAEDSSALPVGKSEIRRTKDERNPKFEIRNKSEWMELFEMANGEGDGNSKTVGNPKSEDRDPKESRGPKSERTKPTGGRRSGG
jgi:hypothetical protein